MNPVDRLLSVARKPARLAVGLMSGMSRDGLDLALVRIGAAGTRPPVELLASTTRPYPEPLRERLRAAEQADPATLAELDAALAARWAGDVLEFLALSGTPPQAVDVLGSHGQTVYHRPREASHPAVTLQIGDGDVLAERTGILTVSDLRRRDVAAGGEGAPLIPMADWLLYAEAGQTLACHNLGSIANVTVLPPRVEDLLAFDTGPANALIDAFARRVPGGPGIDQDGGLSARGKVDDDLLLWFYVKRAAWLAQAPPKSAGYETFGAGLAEAAAQAHPSVPPVDLVRTAVTFTARTVTEAYERQVLTRFPHLRLARFSGGGCHNATLMASIRAGLERLGVAVEVLPPAWIDAKEAVGFALLADRTVRGLPGSHPGATGASRPVVLGKISL